MAIQPNGKGQSGSVTTEPVASLQRVSKRYGQLQALHDFSLDLYPGEVVALLGPNGAGKSTAVRLLLGLSTPTAGTVRVLSGNPRSARTRTRIGAMLQVGSAPATLTVREHVQQFRSYYPAPLPYAEVVELAGLAELQGRRFAQLSGGEKQRLLFALSVCGDPDLLLLDEPTVGMDVDARQHLWAAVRALGARGKTVLLTTHYLHEADALATRVVVLSRGTVLWQGTPAALKQQAAARRIRCCTALLPAQLRALPGVSLVEQAEGLCTLTTAEAEQTLRHLLAADPTLAELEVTAPGLEEAFLTLTARAA